MNYGCILLMILGFVMVIVGLYISKGNGELLKPYGTKKKVDEIKKSGRVVALVGVIIFVVFLLIFLLTM